MQSKKIQSGLAAGISAIVVILAMSLNIGGIDNFGSIVKGFGLLFFAFASAAFVLGLFLARFRVRWSVLSGAVIGLLCGFGVVIYVVSQI